MSKCQRKTNHIERRTYEVKCLIDGIDVGIFYHFYNCMHVVDLHCHLIMLSIILGISDKRAAV